MPLPYPPAIPWVLVVWTLSNGDLGANQVRYYPSQYECLIARQAVLDIYTAVRQDEQRPLKLTAMCMPVIKALENDED